MNNGHRVPPPMAKISTHPLSLELHSMRTSLSKFQHVAHHASMQLQGKVMEVTLGRERESKLESLVKLLETELEALRNTPLTSLDAQAPNSGSTALAELTLAHRRLSQILDASNTRAMSLSQSLAFTEFGLMRALATAEAAENAEERWRKSLEAAEEDLRTEREDRRKDAEERRVLELALKEALARLGEEDNEQTEQTTMQGNPTVLDARDRISRGSGDVDQRKTTSNPPDTSQAALHEVSNTATVSARDSSSPATTYCPTCSYPQPDPDPSSPSALTTGTPSNILLGINGIRRLFSDFSQSISAKEKAIVALERERARLQVEMEVLKKSEELERRRRVENEEELARIKENDEGAAKVVERYMAFTQKTTTQLHQTMVAQTTRLNATIATLRSRLLSSETHLSREIARSASLRAAMDELAEGFERETFGRRRETALRIKAIEREEKWAQQGERWRDRVRRERGRLGAAAHPTPNGNAYGLGPASASTTSLNSLGSQTANSGGVLPSGNQYTHDEQVAQLWELLEAGLQLLSLGDSPLADAEIQLKPSTDQPDGMISTDGHTAREILAQDIFLSLMHDLENETKRRVALEKEVMSKVAAERAEGASDTVTLDSKSALADIVASKASPHHTDDERDAMQLVTPETDPDQTPKLTGVEKLDDCQGGSDAPADSVLIENAQPAIPTPSEHPTITQLKDRMGRVPERYASLQKSLHDCACNLASLREQSFSGSNPHDDTASKQLTLLLDGIHDVIEDVRVEVEIAIADDERVAAGLQTLLALNPDIKSIASARAFIDGDGTQSGSNARRKIAGFQRRLGDVEHDLVQIKIMDAAIPADLEDEGMEEFPQPRSTHTLRKNAYSGLQLRTVRAPSRSASQVDLAGSPSPGMISPGNGLKRGFFGSLGRSLTGTTPTGSVPSLRSGNRAASLGMFRSTSLSAGSVGLLGNAAPLHSDVFGDESGAGSLIGAGENEDDVE